MACDTAFRVVARRHLADLTANHEATCSGDPAALHQMRIALTRLRTAILFFAPMIDDPMRMQIKDELKWLNGWSAAATFEGEFSDVTRSYAGKGVVRYAW